LLKFRVTVLFLWAGAPISIKNSPEITIFQHFRRKTGFKTARYDKKKSCGDRSSFSSKRKGVIACEQVYPFFCLFAVFFSGFSIFFEGSFICEAVSSTILLT
jgi:hypothetical protein